MHCRENNFARRVVCFRCGKATFKTGRSLNKTNDKNTEIAVKETASLSCKKADGRHDQQVIEAQGVTVNEDDHDDDDILLSQL